MTTTTKQKLIPAERLKHNVTPSVTRNGATFVLWAKCHDCGWWGYTPSHSFITVLDLDKLLLKHHTH